MAYYAALVSVVQLLKDITHHDRYPNFLLDDKHGLHVTLYAKFNLLLEMLDDYSPKDDKEESNDILEWRIRDAAYGAQDLIESQISTTLLPRVYLEKRTSGVERFRRLWASSFRRVLDNIGEKKYYRDLEKVEAKVDSIVEDLMRIKVESNSFRKEDSRVNPCIPAEAFRGQTPIGRNNFLVLDENLMATIEDQIAGGVSLHRQVISIVGMGGLGKTTLARYIFDSIRVHDRFDCCAWVTVSQTYHLRNIVLAIANSLNINKEESDEDGEEILLQCIYTHLYGRRYFIVIDDIWEAKLWSDNRWAFPDNSNGSRVMITTRLSDVADSISSSIFIHQMQFLDEDRSWRLLRHKVFEQLHCPRELEVIGKLIANKCCGLPLTIVVIAGVLSNVKMAPHDWEDVAGNVTSAAVYQNDEHFSKILSLSYKSLPHRLKPCFLYLGGLPEDYEISVSKLIRLWAAEGFLKTPEFRTWEDVGEEYFEELVNRNLVIITKIDYNGKFKRCVVHDLLRNLCSQRAHYENFLLCVQQKDDFRKVPMGNARRLHIQAWDEYSSILKYLENHGSNVRSVISFSCEICLKDQSLSVASGCKLLRILDTPILLDSYSSCPDKFFELLHLRYLTLGVDDTYIPSRILQLRNLQTLIVDTHVYLPDTIWKMRQLRHIISKLGVIMPPIRDDETRIIDRGPLLGSLQTISRVINFRFTHGTIKMIPVLKKLEFQCHEYEGDQSWEEFGLSNLVYLHRLETLSICFSRHVCVATPLPENFALPRGLTKLSLSHCRLPWIAMRVVGSLHNLRVLKLRENAFVGQVWEPTENQFLNLKFLLMQHLDYLEHWRAEHTHFPRLEHLRISFCDALKGIPPGIGDIPTLQLIELGPDTNSYVKSSALSIQEEQQDNGNYSLEVHVSDPYIADRVVRSDSVVGSWGESITGR